MLNGETVSSSSSSSTGAGKPIDIESLDIHAAAATAIGVAAAKAKVGVEEEEMEIKKLIANIVEKQLRKVQLKVDEFEKIQNFLNAEKQKVCSFFSLGSELLNIGPARARSHTVSFSLTLASHLPLQTSCATNALSSFATR